MIIDVGIVQASDQFSRKDNRSRLVMFLPDEEVRDFYAVLGIDIVGRGSSTKEEL